ncbi:MAG: hypothetical protein JWN10_1963 [Solirubrobacterales bacterium]|nr:hypothetical protein [Solirubrobacterales bacterium]
MAGPGEHTQQVGQRQQNGDISQQITKGAREAGEALVKEFAKDITAAEPSGDQEVMVAFALGWQMSELYKPDNRNAPNAKPENDLPGLGHLGGRERAELGLKQLQVGLKKLETTIKNAGLEVPSVTAAANAIPDQMPNDPYEKAIFELHVDLLTTLTAAHFKLGKAYGLGRALADTTRLPDSLERLKTELEAHRITNLTNWLSDLTSLFPAHTGHVVHDSLEAWRDWAAKATAQTDPDDKAIGLLRRQGQRWRAMLSGEKRATDALKLPDYVEAAEQALSHASTLALGFLGRFKLAVSIAVFLFVAGVALVIWDPTGGSLAGGIAGIVASLGLTWKGVGASLGNSGAAIERPVWEGAVYNQFASSISLIPGTGAARKYILPRG